MSVRTIRVHHIHFAVCGGVPVFETIHATGHGSVAKLSLLIVQVVENIWFDGPLSWFSVNKANSYRQLRYSLVDGSGADPLNKTGSGARVSGFISRSMSMWWGLVGMNMAGMQGTTTK